MSGVRDKAARKAAGLAAVGALIALAGCGGNSSMFNGSALDLFSTSSKATQANAAAPDAPETATDIECPDVKIRDGAATLTIGSNPKEQQPSPLDVRYQGSIVRTARECHVANGVMTMKVGIEGRIITGPAGGPGTVDVPLRVAVVQDGLNPEAHRLQFRQGDRHAGGRRRSRDVHAYRRQHLLPAAAAARADGRLCGLCRLRSGRRQAAGKEEGAGQAPRQARGQARGQAAVEHSALRSRH